MTMMMIVTVLMMPAVIMRMVKPVRRRWKPRPKCDKIWNGMILIFKMNSSTKNKYFQVSR